MNKMTVSVGICLMCVALAVWGQAAPGSPAEPASGIPFEAALKDARVALTSLSSGQRDSLILGNGDLYGIVWEAGGGLYMRVTKNDIWDARVDTSKDPPLPKVDIRTGKVSGSKGAPPSYKLPYPQPRCAAAIRFGAMRPKDGVQWACIRRAPKHRFEAAAAGAGAAMQVSGAGGASTGYRATLSSAAKASALLMKIKGSANASYYVNVYGKGGKAILASGWKQSPTTLKQVKLTFASQAVGQVEVYTRTSDGALAENRLHSLSLSGPDGKTDIPFSIAPPLRAVLDLRRAVATIKHTARPATTVRILAHRNVVLIHTPAPVALEPITARTLPAAVTGKTAGTAWLHMKMPGDVDYKGMEYALALAGKGDLKAISLVSSFDGKKGDVRSAAIAMARQTIAEKEADLIAGHERAWRDFWSRSGIALADQDLQRWWYRIMYFARTISRPSAAPPGLMPPLATDATPWHADYHFNYNSWQPFWSVVSSNHPELADSWISYVHGLLPRAKWLAKETYDCEGVFYSISQFLHEPDPAVCKSKNKRQLSMNPWGLTIGMVGMTAQSLWHKHLCQPDRAYLEAKIYPSLREAARFYVSYMEKCRKDSSGKVILGPSYSPEHGPMGIANCPFDIAYVHYTFDAFSKASKELAKDNDLAAKCRAMKNLLPDYPVALDANGKRVVVDWQGCKYKQVRMHNITVPATPVFPAEQVTWFSPEPTKALFRRTIGDTRFNGNNSHVIFNIAKARLSMPEAVTNTKKWFKSRELPNGLFVWQGHAHGTFMPESIGVAALVAEFLMQSAGDTIRVFPCWPSDKDAKFCRLRAQGGFLVSAEFADGQAKTITVTSTVGGRLRLLSPWKTIRVNGKQTVTGADGIVELQTKANEIFRFAPGVSRK